MSVPKLILGGVSRIWDVVPGALGDDGDGASIGDFLFIKD